MKKFLGLALIYCSGLSALAGPLLPPPRGFESGNGIMQYVNPSDGFETLYPKTWGQFDLDSSVSFVEGTKDDLLSLGEVDITTRSMDDVNSVEQLKGRLDTFQKRVQWRKAEVGGRPAFGWVNSIEGALVIFREPGRVTSIRFRAGLSKESVSNIKMILSTLQFY